MKIDIAVSDVDIENTTDAVQRIVAERILQTLAGPVAAVARRELDDAAKKMIEERLTAEIEHVIAEGWTPTTSYGEKTGKTVTLKQRISDALTAKTRTGGYDSPEYTMIDRVLKETVKQVIDKEFAALIKEAKLQFQNAINDEMGKRLAEAVKAVFVK